MRAADTGGSANAARAVVPTRTPATTATPTTRDAGGHDVCGRSRPTYRGTRFAGQVPEGRHRRHRGRRHESAKPQAGSEAAQVGRVHRCRYRSKVDDDVEDDDEEELRTTPRLSRSTGWWSPSAPSGGSRTARRSPQTHRPTARRHRTRSSRSTRPRHMSGRRRRSGWSRTSARRSSPTDTARTC